MIINSKYLKSLSRLILCNLIYIGPLHSQDTIRIVDGDSKYFEFINEQHILKDTAQHAHYMVYSRYIESVLIREFDVVDRKLEGKDITYSFPFNFPYSITHWKNGLMNGRCTLFKGDTIPDFEIEMENGIPHGEYSRYEIVDDSLLKVVHGFFNKGIMDSIWTQYMYAAHFKDYQYVLTYTIDNGELLYLSWKPIKGTYTLIDGNGFISINGLDTTFYQKGIMYKWVNIQVGSYNMQNLSHVSEINSEGVIHSRIYVNQSPKSIEYPIFETNYIIVDDCIDTTHETLDGTTIQYIKLQKLYQLIPHGTFIGYPETLWTPYRFESQNQQLPIYNSLQVNPYFEILNFSNNPASTSVSRRQFHYGKLIGKATFSNINKIIELDANEKTEIRRNIYENEIVELPIYFAISGNTFYIHFPQNRKNLSFLHNALESTDIKVRIDYNGLIYAQGSNCQEILVGKYNIITNNISIIYNQKVFNQYGRYQFYQPSKISNDGIHFKGHNDYTQF